MFTIAQPPVFIGKCLDLRYDGFGRFPPLPSSLDFRTPGDQFLDETLEIDPIVTWRHGDCGIERVAPPISCAPLAHSGVRPTTESVRAEKTHDKI